MAAPTEGAAVGPLERAHQPIEVPLEGAGVPHQGVAERHGLRMLQVRVARHHGRGVLAGPGQDHALEGEQPIDDAQQQVAQVEAIRRGVLVVPAAAGLEPPGDVVADAAGQEVLDLDQVGARPRVPREAVAAEVVRREQALQEQGAARAIRGSPPRTA